MLRELHDRVGVGISLDNFGRGFSSLESLFRLPIDKLKVDRLFVNLLDEDSNGMAIVRAMIALGKNLEKVLVAEGVETQSQLDFLRAQGCEQAQGYFFSEQLSSPSVGKLLADGGALNPLEPAAGSISGSR